MAKQETIGTIIDRAYKLRAKKQKLAKEQDKLAEEIRALSDELIKRIKKSDAQGVTGKIARASINTETVPTVKDWKKLYAYVTKTGDFSLLQRRPSSTAFRERWEAGEKIPGVDKHIVVKVSLTKASAKRR